MDSFYDNDSIIKYLDHMAYLNTISYCLLSGCGIKESITGGKSKFSNVSMSTALYKKALPKFMNKPENPYDFNTYQWKNKKIKRKISTLAQSLSVLSMNLSARKILSGFLTIKNGEYIAYYFVEAGVNQLNFMYDNLFKENLLYDCKLNKGISEKNSIDICEDNLSLLPQYYAIEAVALTQDLLEKTQYNNNLSPKCQEVLKNLLPDLCHIAMKDSLYTTSRSLCQICDSLLNIYKYTNFDKALIYDTVNVLGQELCERISSNGDILRLPDDNKISSFFTTLIALSCLSKLYINCKFDNYLACSKVLYKALCTHWNEEDGMFIKNEENRIEYSSKDIGAILSALKNFRSCADGPIIYDLDKKISNTFKNMILKAGVFVNQSYPILEDEIMNLPKTTHKRDKYAPVFLDKVEYKRSKKKFKVIDESFNAEHALWMCRQLL